MKIKLSLTMITYNAEATLAKTLASVKDLVDEKVIVDCYSNDKTIAIAKKFNAKVYSNPYESEGAQRNFALKKAQGEWILALDDDELVSRELRKEILKVINSNTNYNGFKIPYQNFFLGRPLNHGGENYEMMRLFKRTSGTSQPYQIHAQYELKRGVVGNLRNKIYHYSYRSLSQLYIKFTFYAFREAKIKIKNDENASLRKMVLYPLHMFWARYVESKGYRDGVVRIPLDVAFAYMEFLTYLILLLYKLKLVGRPKHHPAHSSK